MRTRLREVIKEKTSAPNLFPQYSRYSENTVWYDLIRITLHHWHLCISHFMTSQKVDYAILLHRLLAIAFYCSPKTTPAWPSSPILANSFSLSYSTE